MIYIMDISILIRQFWEKGGGGVGPVALQSSWPLERVLEPFNSRSNEPSPDILKPLSRYDDPWKKSKKQQQKTRIRDLSSGTQQKIPHFCR